MNVKRMSELCPKKYKTFRTRFDDYGHYNVNEMDMGGIGCVDYTDNETGNKETESAIAAENEDEN